MFDSLSRNDLKTIQKIAQRRMSIMNNVDNLQLQMDIACVKHVAKTSKPREKFNLETLLNLPEPEFLHDIHGIQSNIDRDNRTFNFALFFPHASA